jgi:hypothetical protein
LTEATGKDYSAVMNFSIPEEKEIRTAFSEGEEAVVALFGGVTAQVEELAAQLEKQAGMLDLLQNCLFFSGVRFFPFSKFSASGGLSHLPCFNLHIHYAGYDIFLYIMAGKPVPVCFGHDFKYLHLSYDMFDFNTFFR